MNLKTTVAALIVSAFALPVLAQSATPATPAIPATPASAAKDPAATPGIDKRQANQERRIDRGVQSGALTEKEAARMEKGQERVQKMEDKAKSDGTVTMKERARLSKAQDVQSKRIYRQKHDRQHDYDHDGRKDRPRKGN